MAQQRGDLIPFQEMCLRWSYAFGRNGGHLFARSKEFRNSAGQILIEGSQGGEPLIARVNVVVSVLFEVPEKMPDTFRGKIGQGQVRDLPPGVLSDKTEGPFPKSDDARAGIS